ncbi:Peroxisomal membrane protein PEX31 [Wickerhamomyces ciferrii]|uniref:Peroxisomal membrane protein PEX31 n=1 Tax=Wickerhamomyces ciferrii (strain ATCC 14091 / BCRC 22168 / CBS 111 / JCM 3599 / NBRC 0793 / NRRL Y-1031 F-60-10) TaxID=1206466 RepID=K0KV25_WICCF|nr:Peroxisomal membrane protein PEX31 [Wickerhamomyces ciferrii]CCH47091.1 Peroxisomal membrane protein PEX31 [Wickerhamomyces ciferrii]
MSAGSHAVPEDVETRAAFTGRSSTLNERIGGVTKTESSPLLSSTPVTVSKVLVKSYPYFVIADKLLSVLTWTNEDTWLSLLVVGIYATLVLYFESIVTYFGHILAVAILVAYSILSKHVETTLQSKPTLDDIVQLLTTVTVKADLFFNPITSLALTSYDIKRLLFTTIFLSPLYVIITYFILTPRTLLLLLGLYCLTYHSIFSRVTRKVLWKFRLVRLLSFYLTGLDFGGININKDSGIFAAVKKVNERVGIKNKDGKPIVFTYVLYENQRRWLGIGWTPNLLSYERTAWTDEFLNESSPTDKFELPETEIGSGLVWRWVDKSWRLDLTNDGAFQLPSSKPRSTANPGIDDGFIYYDNTWKKPSTEDSFSKYTRRRRWIRTAELVPINSKSTTSTTTSNTSPNNSSTTTPTKSTIQHDLINSKKEPVPIAEIQNVQASGITSENSSSQDDNKTARKRKSLRFDDHPTVLESVKALELSKKNKEKELHKDQDKDHQIDEKENQEEFGNSLKEKEKDN